MAGGGDAKREWNNSSLWGCGAGGGSQRPKNEENENKKGNNREEILTFGRTQSISNGME